MILKIALLIAALLLPILPARAEKYVLIGSCEGLIAFAQGVETGEMTDAHALLTADIEITRPLSPIGDAAHPFAGTFDGQGHTLSGGVITGAETAGLFGALAPEGAVRNLKLDGFIVQGASYAGVLAGRCAGLIEDCAVTNSRASIFSRELWGTAAGALCGSLSGAARRCAALACDVYSPARSGGLAGQIASGDMENCLFTGTVNCPSMGDAPCGGLTGAILYDGGLKNCLGGGTVSAPRAEYVGGIAGALFGGAIDGCAFSGAVESSAKYMGEVSGWCADRAQIAACRHDGASRPIGRGDGSYRPLARGDLSAEAAISLIFRTSARLSGETVDFAPQL